MRCLTCELEQASVFLSTPTYQGSFISISSPEPVVSKTESNFVGCISTDVMKEFKFPRGMINNSSLLKQTSIY